MDLQDHTVAELDDRGFERLLMKRNVHKMTQHSAAHAMAWKANGDIAIMLLRSDPDNPDPNEVCTVLKYCTAYGTKGADTPGAQKQLFRDVVEAADSDCSGRTTVARMLNAAIGRRMIGKPECMVEAAGLDLWKWNGGMHLSLIMILKRVHRH